MSALIAVGVAVGTAFLVGMLVGGELQRHILRGHEGTRAEKLRTLQRQRAEHIHRRQVELYGQPLRSVPGSRPAMDDADRWWRRHPGGEGPVRRPTDDPPRDRSL